MAQETKNHEFLRKVYPLMRDYQGSFPNLRDIFRPEATEWLLMESIRQEVCDGLDPKPLIRFVINNGYKDEPKVDQNGTIILHRTTPIHLAAEVLFEVDRLSEVLDDLFQIYDRFDVNYIDEKTGQTHFDVACEYGLCDVVEKFLEFGQDPNCVVGRTGNTQLLWALMCHQREVVKLLLKHGADPNLASHGLTPLHFICVWYEDSNDAAEMFFKINEEFNREVQLEVRDGLGETPLLTALECGKKKLAESLLRRGANPTVINAKGETALHIICKRCKDVDDLAMMFFKVTKELNHPLLIDAPDKLGNTPLQLAVLSLAPKTLDVLLKYGADLSSFAFPAESYFTKDLVPTASENVILCSYMNRLRIGSRVLIMIDMLENRGYELNRGEALKIMGLFTKYRFYYEPVNLNTSWYDDEEFANEAKEMMMKPNLSLYDLVKLRPEEAEKKLTCSDYYDFARSEKWWKFPEKLRQAWAAHLCETMSRGFFRRWALDSFSMLTSRDRQPIEGRELIINGTYTNRDLHDICLTAAGLSS